MNKKGEKVLPIGPYPVDNRGIAIPTYEVSDVFFDPHMRDLPHEQKNNHHQNFYARLFGRFVISETFRDLESQQIEMVKWRHTLLHQQYTGIKLPRPLIMMEEIEAAMERGEKRKIYVEHEDSKGYEYFPIKDKWKACQNEYNELAIQSLLLTIRKRK